jgi:hypothetical protein
MTVEDTPEADRVEALERRLLEMEESHRGALLRAGLRAEATRAGMVDLDGLKLVDTAHVTLDAAGDVVGASALMSGLRRTKPWLFGLPHGGSSTSVATAPPAQAPQPRRATEMTHDEWRAARAELLRRV